MQVPPGRLRLSGGRWYESGTAVDAVLITGFWLSACVSAMAASCAQRFAGRVPVVVPLSLAATRLKLYDPIDDHPADVDVAGQLQQLRARGAVVCDTPDTWRSELARSSHGSGVEIQRTETKAEES